MGINIHFGINPLLIPYRAIIARLFGPVLSEFCTIIFYL